MRLHMRSRACSCKISTKLVFLIAGWALFICVTAIYEILKVRLCLKVCMKSAVHKKENSANYHEIT